MSIIAIIPARAGSKRIPDKNIKPLNGKPLIEYSIMSATQCQKINKVVVTSNIDACRRLAAKYGAGFITRSEGLCADNVGDYAVITDALQRYGYDWDLVAYLRPTTPYRADYYLCTAIDALLANDAATGLRSVELMSESAFKCYEIKAGDRLTPVVRTDWEGAISHGTEIDYTDEPNHKCPPTYHPNGYIDLARPEIIRSGQLWGNYIMAHVTPHTPDIDTPLNWQYAEWYGNRFIDTPMRFGRKEIV